VAVALESNFGSLRMKYGILPLAERIYQMVN
jgi:hypothetical protein